MDKYSGKRAVGLGIAARGSSFNSRDTSNNQERNVQYCNRIGCSTRLNSMRSSPIGSSDREKYSSPSFRAVSGSSTRTYSSVNDLRKPNQESQNSSSHKEVVCAETNNTQVENEVSETSSSTSSIQSGPVEPRDAESGVLKRFSVDKSVEVGSSSVASQTRTHKQILKRSVLGNQDTSSGSSNRRSFAPRNTTQATKPVSRGQASASRYGLRNLGCTSISDVLPGCSSSDSSRSRRIDVVKKRSSDGECSTGRGKIMSGSSSGGNSITQRSQPSSSSLSLPERPSSQQASRRTRNWPPSRDGITSVRTRRATNGDTRAKLSEHGTSNSSSIPDPPVAIPELSQTGLTISGPSQSSSSQQSPVETPLIRQSSYGRPGSSNENSRGRPAVHPEDGSARLFSGLSIDRDGFRRFNMEGIAEVLLALERIEQDEELTYEQLLVLETNLFLGGLSFHDQHRDMRLDIDNMSYEELLALEEKMGSVSTALTDEALSKCITNSYYKQSPSEGENMNYGDGDDDIKCSICQEEYVEGDELGKLKCDHRYHAPCVQQWLGQKNWCPICKAPVADS